MAPDRDTRRRLRSLELRSEDLVLFRVVLGVALRVLGAVLCILAASELITINGFIWQPGWGRPGTLEVLAYFGSPTLKLGAGLVAFFCTGFLVRRLVPARVPVPACPACGYQLTTLDDGRCSECAYELTPARDGPMGSMDRMLFARSIIATALRISGIVIALLGVGRFVTLGLTKYWLITPSRVDQYNTDRDLIWAVSLIATAVAVYGLSEWLARAAMLGITRRPRPGWNDETDPDGPQPD
ncbi:MAG: hypothetical protein RIE77_09455 [Phycisphaerales bacterium]|jgi:hypothetical protein